MKILADTLLEDEFTALCHGWARTATRTCHLRRLEAPWLYGTVENARTNQTRNVVHGIARCPLQVLEGDYVYFRPYTECWDA